MDPKAVPWQVEWKRPRWNQISSSTQDDGNNDPSIVVGSASSAVDPEELPISLASQIAAESTLLLSVTLLSRQSANQINSNVAANPVASELLLELHSLPATVDGDDSGVDTGDESKQVSSSSSASPSSASPSTPPPSSSLLLASKRLQWPEAIFDAANQQEEADEASEQENNEEEDEDAHNITINDNNNNAESPMQKKKKKKKGLSKHLQDWFTLSPLMGQKVHSKTKAEQAFLGSKNPNGLLSAVLIRRPTDADQNPNREDVMDTIALMSLGMANSPSAQHLGPIEPSKATSADESLPPSRDDGGDEGNDDADADAADEAVAPLPDLYLACMTVRGLVAIYSPWKLLQLETKADPTEEPNVPKLPADVDFVDSLATLFLGQEIFSAPEQAWKPLSEPLSTISLSILEQNQVYKKRRKNRRALDVSLWNHLVESATIPHRTVANRASKLAVAGPSYLAVFGSGIPYTQVFRHDDESSMGGHQSGVEEQQPQPQQQEEEQQQHQDEWWDHQQHQEQLQQESKQAAFLRPRFDSNGSDWSLEEEDEDDGSSVPKVELISGPIQEWVRRDSNSLGNADANNENDETNNVNKSLKKWWQKIRESSSTDTEDLPLSLSTGGFITFCSISQWSETRTLFLPFVPKQISYFPEWNSMEIVLVMGQTQAIAVRLDSSQAPVVIGNVTDQLQQSIVESVGDNESLGASTPVKMNENYMNIKRFQVLPIALPQSSVESRILCGSAPGVQPPALLQLFTEETHHGLVLQKSLKGITALGTIELSYAPSDVAKIHVGETESLSASWSVLGQGWSLLGTNENVYFICWEGATVAGGVALVQVLHGSPVLTSSLPTCVDFVSQRRPNIAEPAFATDAIRVDADESIEMKETMEDGKEEEGIDRIVVEAMESVSGFSLRSQIAGDDDDEINPESHIMSSREKSVRLLSRCSSWTRLEHTLDKMEHQIHIVSLRSDRGDYFTASSIALNLLQDVETLYHLWRTADKIDSMEEQSKLEGLLDGIEPIEEVEDENGTPSPAKVQLADMTVGCLAKGGLGMSSTLEKFLRENKLYDPSRACLMLVSTTAKALSDHYEGTATSTSVEELLWPVRSLLEAGVARDCLPTALLLLNSTIPDELRGREQESGVAMIDVTSALVSAIVASDKNAPELLLNLTEGSSKQKYWESLAHDTQLVLSLTCVNGGFPLLHLQEIRSWARERLNSCIDSASSTEIQDLPSDWLKKLVSASLSNAGCDQEEFDIGTQNENAAGSTDFEDSVNKHRLEMLKFRKTFTPVRDIAGVDFDLLIPCLLVLHRRGIHWSGDDCAGTQSVLDAACYVAGRHSNEQFAFAFNSSTVMKQCAMAGNVRAAANLIGGTNGFVLNCSAILIKQLGVSMKDAEAFLLDDSLSASFLESFGGKGDFQLGEAHRDLLLLLDEHILTIQTYGEFDTVHIRGRVDPVFSSRSILRAWLCISYADKTSSVDWLVEYLRKRLRMEGEEGRSPYRLPCAALCRSLFWAEGGSTSDSLSVQMGIDITFLVQVALSCCGLVESIPLSIAKEISAKSEKPKLYSMPQVQFPSASRLT
ncbi:MAG: hypothetical protein SGBAC_005697 [Bacillariaceae sp.]